MVVNQFESLCSLRLFFVVFVVKKINHKGHKALHKVHKGKLIIDRSRNSN